MKALKADKLISDEIFCHSSPSNSYKDNHKCVSVALKIMYFPKATGIQTVLADEMHCVAVCLRVSLLLKEILPT